MSNAQIMHVAHAQFLAELNLDQHAYTEVNNRLVCNSMLMYAVFTSRNFLYIDVLRFENISNEHNQHLSLLLHRFFKSYFLDACLELTADPVANVRLHLAALLPALKQSIR